tara:strand:+ start:4574 stop:5137 length:564 start_codon:yes stop_codon:yes gene_type:complete
LVKTDNQKKIVKHIIENYHSYVPTSKSVGRRIDWLIYDNDEFPAKAIGMIGVGSSVYPPPKSILEYMSLTKFEYKDIFNTIANNWRFCMVKSIPNAGSQILKQLRQLAPIEWKKKYGDDLKYLITFVGGGNNGAVYKADNWEMIGETAGLPKHKSSSMKWNNKEELKDLFVKPTGENKKMIFIRRIK